MEKVIKPKDVGKLQDVEGVEVTSADINPPVKVLELSRRESPLPREDAFAINDLKKVLCHTSEIKRIGGAEDAINRALNPEKTEGDILTEVRKLDDKVKENIVHIIEKLRRGDKLSELTGNAELKLNNSEFFREPVVGKVLGAAKYK